MNGEHEGHLEWKATCCKPNLICSYSLEPGTTVRNIVGRQLVLDAHFVTVSVPFVDGWGNMNFRFVANQNYLDYPKNASYH